MHSAKRYFITRFLRDAVIHGHLATERGRHYASLSLIVIAENGLMTGASPSDSMTAKTNDNEAARLHDVAYWAIGFGIGIIKCRSLSM